MQSKDLLRIDDSIRTIVMSDQFVLYDDMYRNMAAARIEYVTDKPVCKDLDDARKYLQSSGTFYLLVVPGISTTHEFTAYPYEAHNHQCDGVMRFDDLAAPQPRLRVYHSLNKIPVVESLDIPRPRPYDPNTLFIPVPEFIRSVQIFTTERHIRTSKPANTWKPPMLSDNIHIAGPDNDLNKYIDLRVNFISDTSIASLPSVAPNLYVLYDPGLQEYILDYDKALDLAEKEAAAAKAAAEAEAAEAEKEAEAANAAAAVAAAANTAAEAAEAEKEAVAAARVQYWRDFGNTQLGDIDVDLAEKEAAEQRKRDVLTIATNYSEEEEEVLVNAAFKAVEDRAFLVFDELDKMDVDEMDVLGPAISDFTQSAQLSSVFSAKHTHSATVAHTKPEDTMAARQSDKTRPLQDAHTNKTVAETIHALGAILTRLGKTQAGNPNANSIIQILGAISSTDLRNIENDLTKSTIDLHEELSTTHGGRVYASRIVYALEKYIANTDIETMKRDFGDFDVFCTNVDTGKRSATYIYHPDNVSLTTDTIDALHNLDNSLFDPKETTTRMIEYPFDRRWQFNAEYVVTHIPYHINKNHPVAKYAVTPAWIFASAHFLYWTASIDQTLSVLFKPTYPIYANSGTRRVTVGWIRMPDATMQEADRADAFLYWYVSSVCQMCKWRFMPGAKNTNEVTLLVTVNDYSRIEMFRRLKPSMSFVEWIKAVWTIAELEEYIAASVMDVEYVIGEQLTTDNDGETDTSKTVKRTRIAGTGATTPAIFQHRWPSIVDIFRQTAPVEIVDWVGTNVDADADSVQEPRKCDHSHGYDPIVARISDRISDRFHATWVYTPMATH